MPCGPASHLLLPLRRILALSGVRLHEPENALGCFLRVAATADRDAQHVGGQRGGRAADAVRDVAGQIQHLPHVDSSGLQAQVSAYDGDPLLKRAHGGYSTGGSAAVVQPPPACGQGIKPPSTAMFWPVIQAASGPASIATALAMSSGCPSRFSAVTAIVSSNVEPGLAPRSNSVSVAPGETMLAVMPRWPNTIAATFVKFSSAP